MHDLPRKSNVLLKGVINLAVAVKLSDTELIISKVHFQRDVRGEKTYLAMTSSQAANLLTSDPLFGHDTYEKVGVGV